MKVFQYPTYSIAEHAEPWHLVEKFEWVQPTSLFWNGIVQAKITLFCDKVITPSHKKWKEKYTIYNADVHKKHLCKECLKMVRLAQRKLQKKV